MQFTRRYTLVTIDSLFMAVLPLEKVTFDGIVGFTAAYPLSKDWILSVEPTAYISLRNKFRSPQGSSIQTAASGVQVGLSYQF